MAASDVLGVDKFGVLGWSGGGAYALAVASLAPERLSGVVVAAGITPFDHPCMATGVDKTDLRFMQWATERPWLARLVLSTVGWSLRAAPGKIGDLFLADLSVPDKKQYAALTRSIPARTAMCWMTGAVQGGAEGVLADYAALGSPWGFDPGEIRTAVQFWQGDSDNVVTAEVCEALERMIPGARTVGCPGEGHLLVTPHAAEILRQAAGLH